MARRIMSPHKLRELLDEMTLVDTTTKRQDQLGRRIEASFALLHDFWEGTRLEANRLWAGVEAKGKK